MSAPMRTQFAMVPKWVYTRVTDNTALRVYVYLAGEYCDTDRYCFPKEETLAKELGCTVRTIQRALRALQDAGALRVIRSRKTNGHWGRNAYVLPMDDPLDPDMHVHPADQGKRGSRSISAGQHQATNMSHGGATNMSGREPDPQKQPHPEEQTKHRAADAAPSADADGPSHSPTGDHLNTDASLSSQTGLNPKPSQDEEDQSQPPPRSLAERHAVGEFPNLTAKDITEIEELCEWLDSPECERLERLTDLVGDLVSYWEFGGEEELARGMLRRGDHYMKVVNTILKQRRGSVFLMPCGRCEREFDPIAAGWSCPYCRHKVDWRATAAGVQGGAR
jgi:hypothetical protein